LAHQSENFILNWPIDNIGYRISLFEIAATFIRQDLYAANYS